jgi:hypothetical protein
MLAGCGAAAEEPAAPAMSADERAIRETLDRYAAAIRAGDTAGACRLMAREVHDTIRAIGTDCEAVLADRVREGGADYELTTDTVTISGNRAMTRGRAVESDGPRDGGQPMVREGSRWLLTTKVR